MKKNILSFILILIICISLLSCKDERPNPEDIVFPDTVSYIQHVQPLFDAACTFPGCHGEETEKDRGFNLTDYSEFMYSSRQIIVRGNPDASPLIQRVEGKVIPRMPPDRPALNKNQTDGLRRWILQGTRQN